MGSGHPRIVTVPAGGGPELVVTCDPPCSGCHFHGGGVFDWTPDSESIVYAGRDGSLYRVAAGGGPGGLLVEAKGKEESLSSPAVSPEGDRVVFAVEDRYVAISEPGRGSLVTLGELVVSGGTGRNGADPDFVMDPVWHPDGRRVAWVEWDVPDMPWDSSRIVVTEAGSGNTPKVVAGGDRIAVGQPRWSPDGTRLAYTLDASGWPVVWVARDDGSGAEPYSDSHGVEHAEPSWGPGQRTFAWSPDSSEIALCENRGGMWQLRAGGSVHEGLFAGVGWNQAGITAARSAPHFPSSIARIDTSGSNDVSVLARGPVGGFRVSEGWREVSWQATDGEEVHGRLYGSGGSGDDRGKLLVWIHGGPTGQMAVEFNARLAYFLDRGWAVLTPDFRGSSGWGREYLQALRGGWGETDVEDVAAGIRDAHARGLGDPRRTVVMGASSGGMCVLLLLARHPELCAAGVDLYGVTDLANLSARTHRFEAHYTDTMIGPLPAAAALYRERSPLTHAGNITTPLLVLHGDDDKVVPVEQSTALVDRIRVSGGSAELHVYEGEGHGWSDPAIVADELERISAFLASTGVSHS